MFVSLPFFKKNIDKNNLHFYFIFFFSIKLTEEAEKCLVEHYCNLRLRDAGGVTKSSWRITVRQLESLVRLSEAMAKMYCSEEVNLYCFYAFCIFCILA